MVVCSKKIGLKVGFGIEMIRRSARGLRILVAGVWK